MRSVRVKRSSTERWGGCRLGFWYGFAALVLRPLLLLFTRHDWRGTEHVPRRGGVIIAVNHVSYVDPLILEHFFVDGTSRLPRFLAKIEVFRKRFVGRVVRGTDQIPVARYSADSADALGPAVEAVQRGECVLVYPEGTITKDPDYWPMRAKTGVARLAVRTGAPVIPVAQFGAQNLYGQDKKLRLLPPKSVAVYAGPPVDLSAWSGREPEPEAMRAATDAVMARIREQVGELRGEPAPREVYDRDLGARVAPADAGRGPADGELGVADIDRGAADGERAPERRST
ncbi:MAG: lysophospholipid acyltransferase family protein [Frankiaceae bacterium]